MAVHSVIGRAMIIGPEMPIRFAITAFEGIAVGPASGVHTESHLDVPVVGPRENRPEVVPRQLNDGSAQCGRIRIMDRASDCGGQLKPSCAVECRP